MCRFAAPTVMCRHLRMLHVRSAERVLSMIDLRAYSCLDTMLAVVCLLGVGGMLSFCTTPEPDHDAFDERRARMVERDLAARDITDGGTLRAMSAVPRHLFVPQQYRDVAYADHPLPIGYGQTISQPYIVALMTQYLDVESGEKILEVGTGSGYQAAVLAELTDRVYSIEIVEELATLARALLERLGYTAVRIKHGDGYRGWKEFAPFDKIIVTAAADHIPGPLIDQLKEGGRLIMPVGDIDRPQALTLGTKINGELRISHVSGVRFVPLTGEVERQSGGMFPLIDR